MGKHKHAEVIKAWADGAQVQWRIGSGWVDSREDMTPSFDPHMEFRVKPVPKWPETMMEIAKMAEEFNAELDRNEGGAFSRCLTRVANAAIAHACQTGQLMLPDPERDMKIAKAVAVAYDEGIEARKDWIDLSAIIAGVTP